MMYVLAFFTGFIVTSVALELTDLPNTNRHTLRYDFRSGWFVELNWTWPCR